MSRYDLRARGGSEAAELRIYGDIGRNWDDEESNDARGVAEALAGLKGGPLAVRINSFGGSVADGLAIYNALRRYKGEVTTHIDGVAYSIASLIAMAGHEVRIAANGMMMLHAPWGMAVGNAPEMREMADILDKHAEAMTASYVRDGGPSVDTLRAWLTDGADHYFSASEAVALGLADVVDDAEPIFEIAAALRSSGRDYRLPAALRRSPTVESANMADNETTGAPNVAPKKAADVVAAHSATVRRAEAAGAKAEADRRAAIEEVFARSYDGDPINPVTALRAQCLDDLNCDVARAREMYCDYLESRTADPILAPAHYSVQSHAKAPPQASRHLGGAMLITADQRDKRIEGLTLALSVRAGLERDPEKQREARGGELLSMSLTQIMAAELRQAGHAAVGDAAAIVNAYLRMMPVMASSGPSHGGDNLPAVLGNIAEKAMLAGWEAAAETWGQWTQPGTLRNFQPSTSVNMALFDKLNRMRPGQEFEYGDAADQKQGRQLYQHGLRYGFPFEAIINDDVGALADALSGWGEASAATIGDYVHAALFTSNTGFGQTMDEDSKALFHADHNNYIASGSGAVPSETTLNTARTAMLTQTDPNGRKVAALPRYLLHGPAQFSTVRKVLNSQELQSVTVDGATGATVLSGSINTARDMNLVPVEDYRIIASAPGANTWVLAASRRTVEVAGLNGAPRPSAEQMPIGNIWGINYQLTCPFAVTVLDYRGLYMNFGA